jgi:signal transduction histidine kinase
MGTLVRKSPNPSLIIQNLVRKKPRGSREATKPGEAFSHMRGELLTYEQRGFASEQAAAFSRAASSISHDLRHYLTVLAANAEFLYEADKLS